MDNGSLRGTLIFANPGHRERLNAALVAAIAVAVSLGIAPIAHHPAPSSAGLVGILYAVLMVAAVAIAWMFAAFHRVCSYEPLVVLATVYGYAAMMLALYIVAFPGAIGPHGAFVGNATAASLWCLAHVGFIALVFVYGGAERIARRHGGTGQSARIFVRTACACVLVPLCIAIVAVIVMHRPWAIFPDASFTPLFARAICPALAFAYVVAIAWVVAVTRLETTTALWVTVVLVALECEVWTGGIMAGRYYTASWYVGCFEGFVAGFAFLNVIGRMVVSALTVLSQNNRILADRSVRDTLTNLFNRRGFDDALAGFSKEQRRRSLTIVSLLIVDVDHFKHVNDRYGHAGGDRVLRDVAAAISEACSRSSDVCYRIGGEEFAVVLASTNSDGAAIVAERIRKSVAGVRVGGDEAGATADWAISVSIGIASLDSRPFLDHAELYRRADAALYEAKETGRDRVVTYPVSARAIAAHENLFAANRGAA